MSRYASWGNFPAADQRVRRLFWRHETLPQVEEGSTVLPHGLGRSYGDSCLNDGGTLLDTTGLDHLIAFDESSGLLRCEAGVSLETILDVMVPRGWFLPVTPGTKYVTVGGAVANDIHGKNHHRAGTFGRHVKRFELLRSDDSRRVCSREENPDLFRATVGGLGLTGLMTWVELQLKAIESPFIDQESVRFSNLDGYFELSEASDMKFEYTVAWVDCLAGGDRLGRGHLLRGNHASADGRRFPRSRRRAARGVPFHAPEVLLNPLSVRAFNSLYYHRQRQRVVRRTVPYDPFFYPLDSIADWNRLYGKRGFMQYQCVVPHHGGRQAAREIFSRVAARREGSCLVVLKVLGDLPSPGLMSFPRPGITIAMDFANRGPRTFGLLDELDAIVRDHGGRVYPAKDARMSAGSFRTYFPEWREFSAYVDPAFSSGFWRRVTRTDVD